MSELLVLILVIAIFTGLFLALRNVMLWYFRINEMIDLLTQIRNNLRKLNEDEKENRDS